jgi:thiol:disulfide interchange protein DsbA
MKSWRVMLAAALAAFGLCLAGPAAAADLVAGQDYRVINPPLPAPRDKVEVTEFFWYGCPHCFDFEPVLAAWVKRLPGDVSFRRVPALFPNNKWLPAAQLYYTLEVMNLVERLHGEAFIAIHVHRLRLDDERILFDWVATKGVDAVKFREAWSSPAVEVRLQQARGLGPAAGLSGVPAVMVQGRYLALTQGNYEDLLAVVEKLVERARRESGNRQ